MHPVIPTLIDCPECGLPAEIRDRFSLGGTHGRVEHLRVSCVRRHHRTLLGEQLPAGVAASL